MSPSRKNKKSSSESGSASASNTDKSNGETANATKKANSSVADVSKKLKTKKAKPEGKNVWQSVLVIAVIISVISISLPIFFPNLLDNCQHHVCKLVGIWCKDSNQIHAKSGLHSEENVQMGIKKEVSHNKKEKTSQGKTNSEHANSDITSPADREIKVDLDKADKLVEQKRPGDAIVLYDKLLARFPSSPRALYGKAWALEMNSELQRSNALLEQSITTYERMLALPSIPRALHIKAVRQCASRMAFRGWSNKAAQLLESVAHQYPEEFVLWNEAGVQWLMTNQNERARFDFKQALKYNPNSGYAKVHLGFILKVSDLNYESAIQLLEEGIASRESGVIDGRFFFQLGDALYRLGRVDRAYEIYRQGAQEGLFKSMWQRSLYDINRLTGRPWWTVKESGVEQRLKILEQNYMTIREEGLKNLDLKTGTFLSEEENLKDYGDWKQFTLWSQGRRNEAACKKAPKTCALIEQFPEAKTCTRGQVKFSVIHPGTHVWPHCGPTNCRIRCHLGLVVPQGPRIRVGNETRTWIEGKFIIFDDSFEHEVWHDGTELRLVLIVDIWHPEVTSQERATLSPI